MEQNTVKSIKLFGKKFNIVSEADQRDRNNTLYLFARVINKVVYVKFGEAFEQSIWDRYNCTGCSQHDEMIYVWKSAVRDTPIHKVLVTQFKWAGKANQNPLHSKEAYIMRSAKEIDTFIKAVSDIVNKNKEGPHIVSFDSENERRNFHSSTLLNLYKFWNEFTKIGVHPNLNAPWLGDYTHPWTDEDCCKLFSLDDEQTDFICNTLKTHSMKEFINYESCKQ